MPRKKRGYHHGDLRRALIDEALRVIRKEGVEHLTLRGIGASVGVSRTALYRHFTDKNALLAAVSGEGYRMFRDALSQAYRDKPFWRDGFEAMGRAYVRFAVDHPSHYRVMFGGFLTACEHDVDVAGEAGASFQVLVNAIADGQAAGAIRRDDPKTMAVFAWGIVHGIAMLAIDGPLPAAELDAVVDYAVKHTVTGLA